MPLVRKQRHQATGPLASRRMGSALVEMLIAAAVTIISGTMAVGMLSYGSGLWRGNCPPATAVALHKPLPG